MFPYQTVIFDMDGTLIDSGEGIIASFTHALQKLGYPVPDADALRTIVGPPLEDSFDKLIHMPKDEIPQAVELYRKHATECSIAMYRVYPGIRALLYALKKSRIKTAVVTGKQTAIMAEVLNRFRLTDLFDFALGEEDTQHPVGKAALISRVLQSAPQPACMVGDRCFDMQGAKQAGIAAIGAGYGYGTQQELNQSGADQIAITVESLYHILCANEPKPKGVFISVEGPDGSGKTTQVNALEQELQKLGYDILRTREPGGSAIGEKIRDILLDNANTEMSDVCEALLYAAARAQHVHQVIRPAVLDGKTVLCDRFVDSSVAYQGGGRKLGVPLIRQINDPAVNDCRPDVTVYLSIDYRKAMQRRQKASDPDRLESESLAFHERVQRAYEQQIGIESERFLMVNADQAPELVTAEMLEKLLARLDAIMRE